MRRTKRTLAVVVFALASCSSQAVPAATPTTNMVTLRLYASTAMIPLVHDLTAAYAARHPAFDFGIVAGNHETMFEQVVQGEGIYFLTNHLPLERQIENQLWAAPLGQDGIAVIVHPDNPVTGLTLDHLRRIYRGHISNWRDAGGQDMEIIVISREDGSGTRAEFERLLVGERLTTQSAQIAPSSEAMMTSIARQPGAVGYVSMSYLNDTVRVLRLEDILPTPDTVYTSIYPLRATIFVVGLAEPQDDYRELVGWMQGQEGQAIVAAKYAPLPHP